MSARLQSKTMFIKQAANVIQLLEFFASRQRPATLAEIAEGLGWPRSSTHKLLTTLVAKGCLYEPRTRGGYYPSSWWSQVTKAIADAEPLPESLEVLAQEVANKTGETAAIAAPAGTSAILIYAVESERPIRFSPWLGERNPIHASASGRALLSLYSAAERQSLYRKIKFERYTPKSPMSVAEIESALEIAAIRGYHQSDAEVVEDLVAIAVPLTWNGRKLALLAAGPLSRCHPKAESVGRFLRATADKFTAELNTTSAEPIAQ